MAYFTTIIIAAGTAISGVVLGLIVFAVAEIPMILREIAHNTRKSAGGPDYSATVFLSKLLHGVGIILMVAGVAIAIVLSVVTFVDEGVI